MKKIILTFFCLTAIISLNSQTLITIGSGASYSGPNESSPINIWYRSHHCQILYTPTEIINAGYIGSGTITKLGFNIFSTTSEGLPNFKISLKNTTSIDLNTYDGTGLTNVYTNSLYSPTSGGFDLLTLSNSFLWDGSSNLLVDVCFDQVVNYSSTGQVYNYNYSSSGSEYQFVQNDGAPQCGVATASSNMSFKPQIQLEFPSLPLCAGTPTPGYVTSTNSLVCANTTFTLSINGTDFSSGLLFQWQSSADGSVWSNIGSQQSSKTYSISNITDTTFYRCITTCTTSALSNTSTAVVVNFNPLINCYCLPSYALNCSNGDKFSDFSIANVVFQPSNCDLNGYSDSTSSDYTTINISAGTTYSLQANISNSGFNGDMVAGAWIDYNQNGLFDSNEFTYLGYGGTQIYSNNLTVPITAQAGSVRMRLKLEAYYATATTQIDPCDNINGAYSGQILDYKVNITAAPACSGTPNTGDATSTSTVVCENKAFTLDLINNSIANNITYQWQSSLNGTSWANLGSLQNTIPYSIITQSITTYYRCISTCSISALSSTSTPVVVTQNLPTACYCIPDNINCSSASITNVIFETINDNPSCNPTSGYNDNTSSVPSVSLTANQSYTISTEINSQAGVGYVGCWVDYNQNGIFENYEYTNLGNTNLTNTITSTINVPFTAVGGTTRMRLKLESTYYTFNGLNPCTSIEYDGQTLDYLIYITPAASCSSSPNAGDATAPVSAICENTSVTLNLTNNSIVSNMSYQWQSSTDNTNWTNLSSPQTFVPYTISSQSVTSYYRCLVTCLSSSLTSTSTTWTITQNPVTVCYCIPDPADCTGSDVINYVSFATMTNTSSCSANGYSDYTGSVPSATVSAGQSYTLTTALGYLYGEHIYAWIDCDPNGTLGVFDSSEYTDLGSNNGNDTISGIISIPVNAVVGTTRIRVRNYTSMSLGPYDACATPSEGGTYGETEDYLITILPPDCGLINLPPSIPVNGSTNICLGQSSVLDFSSSIPLATGLTYQWKAATGGVYSNVGTNATNFSASPIINSSYYCEISCNGTPIKNTDTIYVNVSSLTVAPVSTNSVCNGVCNGSITLNATSSSSINYTWMPASTSTNDIATGLCAGSYTATVADAQGVCVLTNTFVITQPSPFSVSIAGSSTVICEQLQDTLKSTITGGLSPLSYNWIELPTNTISTNSDYTYTTSIGTFGYSLTVTDANNCVANSNTLSITVNPSSNISGTVTVFPNTSTPVPGYVTLYRYEPFYVRFDSVTYQNIGAAGDYNFVSFTAGNYIIKATPSATNMQVAYGDTAVNWKTAKQIIHGCAVNDIQNIQVKPFINIGLGSGPGSLSGVITETVGFGSHRFGNSNNGGSAFKPTAPGTPIGGIVVKGGKNPGGQMFTQTITGDLNGPTPGQYSITGLPYGDYFILVDIAGLDTNNTYHISISPGNEVFNHLDFTVDSMQINPVFATDVSVKNIATIENKIRIFPNPASNYVAIQYNLLSSSLVKIELFDILGKSVKTLLPLTQQPKDTYKTSWQLDDIKSGLYFVKININGSENTIKLSITN